MNNKITFLLILFLLFSLPAIAKTKIYGQGIQLEQETPISKLLDEPDTYLGKLVQVKGMVVDVCSRRGCWMNIAGDRPYEQLQVKVRDGEIVFPMSASGRMAVVEGIVDVINLSREQVIEYQRHLAQENGYPFDPSTIKTGERFIRLLGTGAEIEE